MDEAGRSHQQKQSSSKSGTPLYRMNQNRQTGSLTIVAATAILLIKNFEDGFVHLELSDYIKGMGQASRIIDEIVIPADFNGITFLAEIQTNMNVWHLTNPNISTDCMQSVLSRCNTSGAFSAAIKIKSKHLRTACKAPHSLAPAYSFSLTFDLSFPYTVQMLQPNKLMCLFLSPKHFSLAVCLCPFCSSLIP